MSVSPHLCAYPVSTPAPILLETNPRHHSMWSFTHFSVSLKEKGDFFSTTITAALHDHSFLKAIKGPVFKCPSYECHKDFLHFAYLEQDPIKVQTTASLTLWNLLVLPTSLFVVVVLGMCLLETKLVLVTLGILVVFLFLYPTGQVIIFKWLCQELEWIPTSLWLTSWNLAFFVRPAFSRYKRLNSGLKPWPKTGT